MKNMMLKLLHCSIVILKLAKNTMQKFKVFILLKFRIESPQAIVIKVS